MEFRLLGRRFDVGLTHVLLNLGAYLAISFAAVLFVLVAMLLSASGFDEATLQDYYGVMLGVLFTVYPPLIAWALLAMAGGLKLKKDTALCRSLAAGSFLFAAVLLSVSITGSLFLGLVSSAYQYLFDSLASLAASAVGAILLYLWLLLFLRPDRERLASIAPYALIFAMAMLVIGLLTDSISAGTTASAVAADMQGAAESFRLDMGLIYRGVYQFLFAIPLLYFTLGKKPESAAAYLFAGLYLGGRLLSLLAGYDPLPSGWVTDIYPLAGSALGLALLYLLARYGANNV